MPVIRIIFLTYSLFITLSVIFSIRAIIKDRKGYRNFFIFPFFAVFLLIIEFKAHLLGINNTYNQWLYNFEAIVEYLVFFTIISNIVRNKFAKQFLRISPVIYACIGLYRLLFILKPEELDTITYLLGTITGIVACIYFFLEIFYYPNEVSLQRQPAFWFCTAILFYYTTTFMMFALNNQIGSLPLGLLRFYSIFTCVLYSIFYILFSIAFLCQIKTRKSLPL